MRIIPILLILLCSSCAGYRFQDKENPFKQYGIRSLSIPMFFNQSSHSNISGMFTKEIYKMISEFDNLKVYGGGSSGDAVLIGIIESSGKIIESIIPGSPRSVESITDEAVSYTHLTLPTTPYV